MMKSQLKKACSVCGKIGHKGPDCYTLERSKAKQEEFYKKMNQRNNKNKNDHNNKGKLRSNNHNPDSRTVYRDVAMTGIDDEMVLIATTKKDLTKTPGLKTQELQPCLIWKMSTSPFWSVT